MDRDTLEDDLDLILGPQPSGEWDWEPRLGAGVPTTTPAAGPEESGGLEETDGTDAEATDPVDEADEDD
jgi:hypothetical protein